MEDILLEVEGVSKTYPGAEGAALEVLRGIHLELRPGATAAVTGPSGSGKTTLMNVIGGLERPSSGRVVLAGAELASLPDRELARTRNRDIGFVFQFHHLLPQCSALENVLIPSLAGHGANPGQEVLLRAQALLDRVGLIDRIRHRPSRLSGGERQRVAVVRALLNRPKLLIADEPTGSLDSKTAAALADLLVELNREEGVALLVATHSQSLAEKMEIRYELKEGVLSKV